AAAARAGVAQRHVAAAARGDGQERACVSARQHGAADSLPILIAPARVAFELYLRRPHLGSSTKRSPDCSCRWIEGSRIRGRLDASLFIRTAVKRVDGPPPRTWGPKQ